MQLLDYTDNQVPAIVFVDVVWGGDIDHRQVNGCQVRRAEHTDCYVDCEILNGEIQGLVVAHPRKAKCFLSESMSH
jgi:hypothetical protein